MVKEIQQLPQLPKRKPDSHKGDFGRILVVAGSRGMSGAAVLCGSAALRGGAGLVRVAVPQSILTQVAIGNPCYTTFPLSEDDDCQLSQTCISIINQLCKENDTLAIGPGLGQNPGVRKILESLVKQCPIPIVIDADGLNALVGNADTLSQRPGPTVITPHPGEMARLLGITTGDIQIRRRQMAVDFAKKQKVVVVLKGSQSIVTDGERVFQNQTGNPGMATGGTGDVLTGLIAALIGQGFEPFAAAQLGVFAHGRAGDLAKAEVGEIGLIASDLLRFLPKSFMELDK